MGPEPLPFGYRADVRLADHATNVHSQYGEDGILAELIRRLGVEHRTNWCAEVGAWDGVFLSNTCNLVVAHGYQAVLIEGDPERAADIRRNHPSDAVVIINDFVSCDSPKQLDDLLATTPIPERFDVLSIDIDGADYWILESLQRYRPTIIIIEFNPSMPNAVQFVQERSTSVSQGSSPRSIAELAAGKGYALVAVTSTNLVLVESAFADRLRDPEDSELARHETPVETLVRMRRDYPNYVFTLFDGTVRSSEPVGILWHGATLPQTLYRPPRVFASYPGSWSRLRQRAWKLYRRARLHS